MQEKMQDSLIHEDSHHAESTLTALRTLWLNKQFCDVVLQIGKHEISAHKAVLACASTYFFELFESSTEGNITEDRFKIGSDLDKDAVKKLVDYAYTGKLDVPIEQAKAVFTAAYRLKMHQPAGECARHLVQHLTPENCIGIRSIPGLSADSQLTQMIDYFIREQIEKVKDSSELQNLPRVKIEILQNTREEMDATVSEQLCTRVLEWIRERIETDEFSVDLITEKLHMLYLNNNYLLEDCNRIPNGDLIDSELIQDYKKKPENANVQLKQQTNKAKKKPIPPAPAKPRQLLYSKSLNDMAAQAVVKEKEWRVIATINTGGGGKKLLALMSLGGRLATISVMQRLNIPTSPCVTRPPSVENIDSYQQVQPMSSAKCGLGTVELNQKLFVCGGYDRGECIKSVELFDPESNEWSPLANMQRRRGRFSATVAGDKVYVIGGSDGTRELELNECYDHRINKWASIPSLTLARSNAGVCALGGKVYCIGGWNGQAGIRLCEVFDPNTNAWSPIAKLKTGRYQVGVCSLGDYIYAVGGTDGWNCLKSVERYDPSTDSWTEVAPLSTARRGCGLAAYDGKLYVVGGSDGTHSLCSTEIYDTRTGKWTTGPNLTDRRANVAVTTVNGKLYAVGGYTGKLFLNTVEYLDEKTSEWTTFTCSTSPQTNGTHNNNDHKANGESNGYHHYSNGTNGHSNGSSTNGSNEHISELTA